MEYNVTCLNITEYNETCYNYTSAVKTNALVSLIVCPFSFVGCLLNISSDLRHYYEKRHFSFFHKCVLCIASCNLFSSFVYFTLSALVYHSKPIPDDLCYGFGFIHEFMNHASIAFTVLFGLQVLLKVSFLGYLIKNEKTLIQKYWLIVFGIVLFYSFILSFIPLMPTPKVYPDQMRFGHYGHFRFPFCEIIGPIPVIVLSTAPVLLGILICILVFSIAIGRFLYLISGQKKKKNRSQILKLFGLLSFPLTIFLLYFPLFVNSIVDTYQELPEYADIYHTFAFSVAGTVNAFLYYFNRKYIYGGSKKNITTEKATDYLRL